MALSKLAVRRLTKLADYMDSLPKGANKHFHMGTYFSHRGEKHSHNFGPFVRRSDLTACGTAACALGWAATMPFFQELGLVVTTDGTLRNARIGDVFDCTSIDVWEELFRPNLSRTIKTPKQWAAHCRRFIRENSE